MESLLLAGRVLVVAGMSALLPGLKGGSLTKPLLDSRACDEAFHAGAECQICKSRFKLCRGYFMYEPFTVVLFEAVMTIVIGVAITFLVVPDKRNARNMLLDWKALKRVAPIGATYALADLMDLAAAKKCSATTLLVSSQMRLPLCALLRSILLGRSQTLAQWLVLLLISFLCAAHVLNEVGGSDGSSVVATVASGAGVAIGAVAGEAGGRVAAMFTAWAVWGASAGAAELLGVLPLILGKALISCGGAVHAEYFLQHNEVQQLPLWVTQVHFKIATMFGALAMGYFQGRRGGRIMAAQWSSELFVQLPPGTKAGDERTPFFGGWNAGTWALVCCLCVNNFMIGDQLRRLTSVAKYVAYAVGLVVSYLWHLWAGGRDFEPSQALCCGGIAVLAITYVWLPGPPKAAPPVKAPEKKDK